MKRCLLAAVLAGAALFVAGVILGRSEERAPAVWREPYDPEELFV